MSKPKLQKNLAAYFDHTILHPDCRAEAIKKLCAEAMEYQFPVVCVPPFFVKKASDFLEDVPIKVATVIGFPMGYSCTPAKVEEIKKAINDGASEVDAVVNIAAVKDCNWNYVRNDIYTISTAAQLKGKVAKIIFETGLLDEDEIKHLCELCSEIKPDFVKTSTGFNGEGATPEIVELLKNHLPKDIKIKASGGIRMKEEAIRLIEAGAHRLGCSSSVAIMKEA